MKETTWKTQAWMGRIMFIFVLRKMDGGVVWIDLAQNRDR